MVLIDVFFFLSGFTDIKNLLNNVMGEVNHLLLLNEKSRPQKRHIWSHVTWEDSTKRTIMLINSDQPWPLVTGDATPPQFTGLSMFSLWALKTYFIKIN